MQNRKTIQRLLGVAGISMLACLSKVEAITAPIDLGGPTLSNDQTFDFPALNGTPLNGESLSVQLSFLNGEFARLFSVTHQFDAFLVLQTDGSGQVGFLQGTGCLLDDQANPLHTPQELGAASSSAAWMEVALFPPLDTELHGPVDFHGIEYDITLPQNLSVKITGGEFRLLSEDGPFGIGPGIQADILPTVPDGGSTWTLLMAGCSLIGLVKRILR